MNQEKEKERHNRILEQINNANAKEELPNITVSIFSSFLANNVYFDNERISSTEFANVFPNILKYGIVSNEVKDIFMEILKKNYPNKTEQEYFNKYLEIANHPRVNYMMTEILERNKKLAELNEKEELKEHNTTMEEIKNTTEVKKLPKVSKSTVSKYISANSKTNYNDKIKASKLRKLVNLLVNGHTINDKEVQEELFLICQSENVEYSKEIYEQIMNEVLNSKKLNYLIEEIQEKEKRTMWIYKNDHDKTMEAIRKAKRISQLPYNLSMSTITSYLSSNSIIYPKGAKITSGNFTEFAKLLIEGKTFNDREIINELTNICLNYYPEKLEESIELLINKFSNLPKIHYYVEEVRESLAKQKEFISRGSSNVNVYFIPNPKSPIEGGKFYNCYISRAQNLDLEDILPLKLDDIVPSEMDVEDIEEYVQENYDATFKAAGGIILNKDETIGNVNIFQPSDGKVGITPEEHSKYQELQELSKQVKTVISRKKKETRDFIQQQAAFLKSQQEIDEELAILEAKIDLLTQEEHKRGGRR